MRQKKQSALQRFAVKFFTPSNLLLALLWVIWLGIAVYVQTHAQEHVVFDPFEILQARRSCCLLQFSRGQHSVVKRQSAKASTGSLCCVRADTLTSRPASAPEQVERGASDKDIRSAYRRLSLIYHPV